MLSPLLMIASIACLNVTYRDVGQELNAENLTVS
jgi:hypothetical protein